MPVPCQASPGLLAIYNSTRRRSLMCLGEWATLHRVLQHRSVHVPLHHLPLGAYSPHAPLGTEPCATGPYLLLLLTAHGAQNKKHKRGKSNRNNRKHQNKSNKHPGLH